jgi:hypothetical protein
MSTPIIIVAGKAGSGKDTVASHIAENYNGVCVAQADPMKRFAKRLLGFTDTQLWGPSAARNEEIRWDDLKPGDLRLAAHWLAVDTGQWSGVSEDCAGGNDGLKEWYATHVVKRLADHGKISARTVLQTLGTEWGRKLAPTMLIDCALRRTQELVKGGYTYTREEGMLVNDEKAYDYAIITDGRFRNEVLGVSLLNGTAFRVDRGTKATGTGGNDAHRSEKELDTIPGHFYTDIIINDSSLGALYHRIDDMMAIHYGDNRRQ